jgi:hypothetical protein
MNQNKLTQPEWIDAIKVFSESNKKYGTSYCRVPVVTKFQMDHDAAAPAPTSFGEVIKYLDIVPRISQMPQETSRPGSSYIRLG